MRTTTRSKFTHAPTDRAEQSRAEQSRAEQSRAEQSRAEQSRAEQSRAEQSRAQHSTAPWRRPVAGEGVGQHPLAAVQPRRQGRHRVQLVPDQRFQLQPHAPTRETWSVRQCVRLHTQSTRPAEYTTCHAKRRVLCAFKSHSRAVTRVQPRENCLPPCCTSGGQCGTTAR